MEFPGPKNGRDKTMSSSNLPEEFYLEILIRLPVKSVLKCKSVCKSWCSMISNPNFARLHLQQNKFNTSGSSLLIELDNQIHSITCDLLDSSLSSREIEDSAVTKPLPFDLDIMRVKLFSSCNGLVLLWIYDDRLSGSDSDSDADDCEGFLCVWNPATGEYKKIPQSPNSYLHNGCGLYGLAYDGNTNNYKIVIGSSSYNDGLSALFDVFSFRSNSWAIIQTPYNFGYNICTSGVLVNVNIHWLGKGERGLCIVYLDSSNDTPTFKEIQLPKVPGLKIIAVGELEEGCLCVVAADPVGLSHTEVWEMQVYGVPESWTKRYVISNERIADIVTSRLSDLESDFKTIWFFKNGKIMFLNYGNVVLYDPNHESTIGREFDMFRSERRSQVNYVESLVSIRTLMGGQNCILEESTGDEA